jgi:hypothetical protein
MERSTVFNNDCTQRRRLGRSPYTGTMTVTARRGVATLGYALRRRRTDAIGWRAKLRLMLRSRLRA